jgi:hypothetical protein
MADPVTLSVGAIAALAFTKFLESSAGEAAKKLTPALLDKIEALRQTIWTKLRSIPAVDGVQAIAHLQRAQTLYEKLGDREQVGALQNRILTLEKEMS